MDIYIVVVDGWMIPFQTRPEKKCFKREAKLYEVNGSYSLNLLVSFFIHGFKQLKFKDITKTWI